MNKEPTIESVEHFITVKNLKLINKEILEKQKSQTEILEFSAKVEETKEKKK